MNKILIKTGVVGLASVFLFSSVSPALAADQKNLIPKAKSKLALINRGTLSAKNGSTLTVTKSGSTFSVNTDDKTIIKRRFGGKGSLDELKNGDILIVLGTKTNETTFLAKHIFDLSIQKRNGSFMGNVASLTESGWVMHSGRGDQTVIVSDSTKFVNRKGEAINKSDIALGNKVSVKGLRDRIGSTITNVSKVKNFSLK